jgi:hypothetical protein
MRINFGREGIPINRALHLVQNEILQLRAIDYEVPRNLTWKLKMLIDELGEETNVIYLEVGEEEYSPLQWTKERFELIGSVPFEICVMHKGEKRFIDGRICISGKLFEKRDADEIEQIRRHLSSFFYTAVQDFLRKKRVTDLKINKETISDFIKFLKEKLFHRAIRLAQPYPWYMWIWEGITQFSSTERIHTCAVPYFFVKNFFLSLGFIQYKPQDNVTADSGFEGYLQKANFKDFRERKLQVYLLSIEWDYLSSIERLSEHLKGLRIVIPADLKTFTFRDCVLPLSDTSTKGLDLNVIRATKLNVQRLSFSGVSAGGFSWFLIRTYMNMLLSHLDEEYAPGPMDVIPLDTLAEVFLPLRDELLKAYNVEVEHLVCLVGAYLNFFNEWLKKSSKKDPTFIPYFTLDKQSLKEIDGILNLTGVMKGLKDLFKKGKLAKKYDKAAIPEDWTKVVLNIHEALSLSNLDVKSLDAYDVKKPFLFYRFSDHQYIVCSVDLLLGLESLLRYHKASGEFGRIKGKIFEWFSGLISLKSQWLRGENVQIKELVGRKLGTDIDILLLKPPVLLIGSCKTEGSEEIYQTERRIIERWDQLKGYLNEIDQMAYWLSDNLERNDIRRRLYDSIRSAHPELSMLKLTEFLEKVVYIIPVVVTPRTEFILDTADQNMLTDWIPRICTPKELLLFLDELDFDVLKRKSFVIKRGELPEKRRLKQTILEKVQWKSEDIWTIPLLTHGKDEEKRELEVTDLSNGLPYTIDVPAEVPMDEINVGEMYTAKIEVFTSKLTNEIEKNYEKLAKENKAFKDMLELAKSLGAYDTLFKFELIEIRPFTQPSFREPQTRPVLYTPTFKRPVTQKTVNEWNEKHPGRPTTIEHAPGTTRTCKICGENFSRTDSELIEFLQPIYPTKELEENMKKVLIDNIVGDLFICSRCDRKRNPKKYESRSSNLSSSETKLQQPLRGPLAPRLRPAAKKLMFLEGIKVC